MSSLLCQFGVVGADAAHIRRLEVALRQAQTEKESILTKLHKLEKQQVRLTCLVYCADGRVRKYSNAGYSSMGGALGYSASRS